MFARRTTQGILQHIVGQAAIFAEPQAFLALFTTAPTDNTGAGAVEVTGGSYARVATIAANWNAASNTDPVTLTNAATLTFPTATASWGTVIAFGLYDALAAGNLLDWDYLGNFQWLPATISLASPGVVTAKAHGYSAADNVIYSALFGGTAPTFSQSNLTGTLAVANPTTDTFTVTNGGLAVNTSSTGSGMVRKIQPQSIPSGISAFFNANQITLQGV